MSRGTYSRKPTLSWTKAGDYKGKPFWILRNKTGDDWIGVYSIRWEGFYWVGRRNDDVIQTSESVLRLKKDLLEAARLA